MKRLVIAMLIGAVGFAAAGAASYGNQIAAAAPAHWTPPQRLTWYWQLQGTVKVKPVQATDMDGFDNTAATVAHFHQLGQRTICYIDVGTAENFRSDYGRFPAKDLGRTNGWPGERWLDVRDVAGLRPIMDARIAMCLQKGFDAVEPDNEDGWENGTGFAISGAQQQTYNHWIADDIHSHGMAAFGKNDPEQAAQSVLYNDGQVEEQDVQYGDDVSAYLRAGKPVLDAEYRSERCASDGQMQAQFDLNLTGATFKPCFAATALTAATSSTFSTTSAGPTYLANSFAGNEGAGGGVANSVPHAIMSLAVSPDGWALTGSTWEEYSHDARLINPTNGFVYGPETFTRQDGGIDGVAIDATNVYYADGAGKLSSGPRSFWQNPANLAIQDTGSLSGDHQLTVDPAGRTLGQMTLCRGNLYVIDQGVIKKIPTSLASVTASWVSANAESLACDRQGDVWALQNGVKLQRYTPTGGAVSSFTLAAGSYASGIAADPTSNSLWVADNGRDQNFKKFSYAGAQTRSLGVKGGYLADGGKIDATHFVGPRGIAIDTAGDIITAESADPGERGNVWSNYGPGAIITKFAPNLSTVTYRDYGLSFVGDGESTADGNRFLDLHFEYAKAASGKYEPYAYTVDPFTNPSDTRLGSESHQYWWGMATRTLDLSGHRYLISNDEPEPMTIYEQQPGSEIMKSVKVFNGNSDWWMDSTGNVWTVADAQVSEYKITGFDAAGVPQYPATPTAYPQLSQLNDIRRIEVHGSTMYLSGFAGSENPIGGDWDGWKSMGRHLLKFNALPTASGWPTPAWKKDFSYPTGNTGPFAYPTGFAGDGNYVGVTWLFGQDSNDSGTQGRLQILNASDGRQFSDSTPAAPSLGRTGWLDLEHGVESSGGWLWLEDDLNSKIVGVCPGACS